MCEYSKFRIESNSYFSIRFETSTNIRNFRILTITDFLLINVVIRFSVNWLAVKLLITGCIFQLPISIYRVQHAYVHARRVFDLSHRSYQRQTPSSSHSAPLRQPAPHLCRRRGRGEGHMYQSVSSGGRQWQWNRISGTGVNYITALRLPGGWACPIQRERGLHEILAFDHWFQVPLATRDLLVRRWHSAGNLHRTALSILARPHT